MEVDAEGRRGPKIEALREQAGYRAIARQYGLVECGGSDYHAFGYPNEVVPGLYGPPPDTADLLFERAQALHGDKACLVPAGIS